MSSQPYNQPPYPPIAAYYPTFAQPPPLADSPMADQEPTSSTASHAPGPSPDANTPPVAGSSAAPSQSQSKRKRKDAKSKVDQSEDDDEKSKRTKTQRACDPCRRKKIRCDIIVDSDPPICQHCQQYRGECTFYLPITETRFKKKRMEEAAQAAAAVTERQSSMDGTPLTGVPPQPSPVSRTSIAALVDQGDQKEVKIYGPTSLSFILHSTPSIPVKAFENYDQRYGQTWEVGKSGDGFIQVSDHSPETPSAQLSKNPLEYRLDRDTLASLINSYFLEIAPQFPVVSEAEFLSTSSPPPVLLYAICAVAASRRGVPREVFEGLRAALNQVLKVEDVLSTANVVNVQALLILAMSGDVHATSIQTAMTAAWLRLGAAIRMAQDLGMYRAEAVKKNVELRRRLWGACVIADRWYGACFGHPFMIDVLDCDVRLPTPDDPNDLSIITTKPNCYLAELIKLSILLGKVTKTIYSPSGLVHATDAIITTLLAEMDAWRENLHPDLVYKGKDSILPAGLLHLFYSCVCMMFWRVFLRLSYRCPAHLKFSLTIERWTQLVQWTRESIEWLDAHEKCFDSWMFVAYAASSCALVQYHTWIRRRDPEAIVTLKLLRDCVQRWEASLQPGHMNARRKTAEIIMLLYEATQLPAASFNPQDEPQRLNPTVGVSDRPPGTETFRKLKFTKDPTRPGGGVFVADDATLAGIVSDVAAGTVVFVQAEGKDGKITKIEHVDPTSDEVASLLVNIAPSQAADSTSFGPGRFASSGPAAPATSTFGLVPDFASQLSASDPLGVNITAKQPNRQGSNVNPSMNYNYTPMIHGAVNGWQFGNGGTNGVQVLNLLDQPALDANGGAYQMLQGIPFDTFSSAGWDEYFARIAGTPGGAQFLAAHQQQAGGSGGPAPPGNNGSGNGVGPNGQ